MKLREILRAKGVDLDALRSRLPGWKPGPAPAPAPLPPVEIVCRPSRL